MYIQLTFDGHSVDTTLNDSSTARDFALLLPLTIHLDDFQGTERVADLPRKLSTEGAPASSDPKAGDLAFYAPWGNLALFYRDGHPSPGLVIIGHLTHRDDIARLADADRVRIQPQPALPQRPSFVPTAPASAASSATPVAPPTTPPNTASSA
ncbi:cyclophilin-like fold protein [Streptomyces sp. NPDC101165]|uniref:cyclophilin-like fold protein n=1 Tax=Streptomyces sp. NPDC101165 TaxID=3366119 RepID=UPI00382383A6